MDHDVDIEEHDVLDNPRVRHLFPDLSKVKTEVIYPEDDGNRRHRPNICFEEDPDYNEESNNLNDSNDVNTDTGVVDDIETVLPQTQMLHKKPLSPFRKVQHDQIELHTEGNSTQVSEKASRLVRDNVTFSSTNIVRTYTKKPVGDTFKCSNKIVIGGNDRNVCKEDYVTKGIPNKIILGSRVVATKSPISVKKEFLPAVVVLEDWGANLKVNPCYCNSCGILFPTKNTLDFHNTSAHSLLVASKDVPVTDESIYGSDVSHMSSSLPVPVKIPRKNVKRLSSKSITIPNSDTEDESVQSAKSFRKSIENIKMTAKSISHFDNTVHGEQCYHCNKIFPDNSALINHLYTLLPDENRRDAPKVKNTPNHAFQCQICNEILSNETIAKFHIKYMHPNENGTAIKTFISKGDGNKINDVAKFKENFSGKTEDNISAGAAITNINATSMELLNKKLNLEFRFAKLVIKNPPIPISVLFKCCLCDLHFINALTGRSHLYRCKAQSVMMKETCKKCTRYFKPCDMVMHELQHLVTKSFKVYTLQFNLVSRILCRCPKCDVCFAESHFWEHLNNPCINKFIYCNKCNLRINRDTYMKTAHSNCGNNIIIDYFDNVEGNEAKKSIDYSVIGDVEAVYKLWFCEICLRCSQVYLYSHQCNVTYNHACGECGLYFGKNAAQQHIEMHDEKQLKVQNYLLYSMQKNKFVQPVLPSYNCCKRCDVNYLNSHNHCGKNFEICNICNKKFEQEHYEAHKQYHDYDLDKLIHKTIDKGGYVGFRTRRYMYQCVLCDCFVSNYDYAVQHAQDHIKNKAMTNIYCKKCHRLYESSYFKTHKHVVITATVLKFDCKKLHDESWFDMFEALDQVEIAYIVTDSVYRDTRSLDLTCLQKGDPDMTLYVCSSCNVVVEKAVLQNHVSYKEYCWENRKYKCSVCKLYFYSPGTLEAHRKLHLSGVKKEQFRIISINNGIRNAAAIKTLLHAPDNRSNVSTNSAAEADEAVKVIELYRCMKCKACHWSATHFRCHVCQQNRIKYCERCKLFYDKYNWSKHTYEIHNDNKNIQFKLHCIQTNVNSKITKNNVVQVMKVLYKKGKNDGTVENSNAILVTNNDGIDNEDIEINQLQTNCKMSPILYKCVYCKICVILRRSASIHKCVIGIYKRFCNVCNELFTVYNWNRHKVIHKRLSKINARVKYFRPKNITFSARAMRLMKSGSYKCNEEVDNFEKSEAIETETPVDRDERASSVNGTPDNQDIEANTDDDTKQSADGDSVCTIYKCKNCKLCLLRYKSAKLHTCVFNSRVTTCRMCKQYYYCTSLHHHRLYCKLMQNNKVQFKYFTPRNVNAKYSTYPDTRKNNQSDNEDNVEKKNIVRIYRCLRCGICYVRRNFLQHICLYGSDRAFCKICKQYYKAFRFYKHLRWHERNPNIKVIVGTFKPLAALPPTTANRPTTNIDPKKKISLKVKDIRNRFISKSATHYPRSNLPKQYGSEYEGSKDTDETVKHLRLYKCVKCNTVLFAQHNVHRHVCVSDASKRYCGDCQEYFGPHNWSTHNSMHEKYKKIKLTFENYAPMGMEYDEGGFTAVSALDKNKVRTYNPESLNANATKFANVDSDKSLSKNEINMSSDDTYRIYECEKCDIYYLNFKTRDNHIMKDHDLAFAPRRCEHCKLKFPMRSFRKHVLECPWRDKRGCMMVIDLQNETKRVHQRADINNLLDTRKSNASFDDAITIDVNAEESNGIDCETICDDQTTKPSNRKDTPTVINIYKCLNCQLCITKRVNGHKCRNIPRRRCYICKQFCSTKHFQYHISLHKKTRYGRMKFIDFRPESATQTPIITQGSETTPGVGNVSTTKAYIAPMKQTGTLKNNVSADELSDYDNTEALKSTKLNNLNIGPVVSLNRVDVKYPISNKGYVNVNQYRPQKRTRMATDHDVYNDDKDYEPSSKMIRRDDSAKQTPVRPRTAETKICIQNIYKCLDCDLCFVSFVSLKTHAMRNKHMVVKFGIKRCRHCKLKLPKISYSRHVDHCALKNKGSIKIIDINRTTIEVIKSSDMIHSGSSSDNDDELTADCVDITKTCDANDRGPSMDSESTIDKVDESIAHCAGKSQTNDDNDQESNPDSGFTVDKADESTTHCIDTAIDRESINSESTVDKVDEQTAVGTSDVTNKVTADEVHANEVKTKLYSCSACDVYFLKAECCQAHVVNHTRLDAREYIQCKLCLLQFLILDLHMHMVTHHGDEFKFENVIVEDYVPNETKATAYNLKDKVQSLIISTTSDDTE